ncbi:hypothetical protein ACVWXO_005108 [Bradyrhizobium sp. LM2.7]
MVRAADHGLGEVEQGRRMHRSDHAEHDGADEGHGEIRGDNAQSSDERHDVAPWDRSPLSRCFAGDDHG